MTDNRAVTCRLQVLLNPVEWPAVADAMPAHLASAGVAEARVWATETDLTCEPDNMLLAQFAQAQDRPPITETLHRLTVTGVSGLDLRAVTRAVVAALPEGTYWYGSSEEGPADPDDDTAVASCAWQG